MKWRSLGESNPCFSLERAEGLTSTIKAARHWGSLGCGRFFVFTKKSLAPSGKTVVPRVLALSALRETSIMPDEVEVSSELSKIAKLNGDFRRNYGPLLGAFLYLRSISAARGRSWFWAGLLSVACSTALAWLGKHGLPWLPSW